MEDTRVRQQGMASWLMQRVSGIFLTYALAVHLWTVHYVNADRLTWEVVAGRLQDGAYWAIYYSLFVPAVVYHAMNGLWGIVLDYDPSCVWRRVWCVVLWGAGLALVVTGYFGLKPLMG
jgi:succinate dehydrogenase hydrophobic anchor subunit